MELVDYVANTPHNTNRTILKQLVNDEKNKAVYESVEELKRAGGTGYEENVLLEILNDTLYYDGYESWYARAFPEGSRPNVGEVYFISINGGVERQYMLSEEMIDTYVDEHTGRTYNLLFGIDWIGGVVITADDGSREPINIVVKHKTILYHKIDEKFLPKLVGRIEDESVTGEIFNSYEGSEKNFAGTGAHAEGLGTTAEGYVSHAEGQSTVAGAHSSHAEGNATVASGGSSHAEGTNTVASGSASHAEGEGTIANGHRSHVQGQYNVVDDKNMYAHIVGNGASKWDRSNAHTIDWNGNAWFAGGIELTSPNGTRFRFMVTDAGNLSSIQLPKDEE